MFLLCIFLFLYSCSLVFFDGRIFHPSLVLLFSINISLCRFLSKKKKNALEPFHLLKIIPCENCIINIHYKDGNLTI